MREQRFPHPHAGILLPRGDDQRGVGLQRAVDHPDAIAETRGDVQVHDARLAARLGIEARRAHRDALVQGNVVAQPRVVDEPVEQGIFGGAGVPEDAVYAVGDEPFHEHLTTAHSPFPA